MYAHILQGAESTVHILATSYAGQVVDMSRFLLSWMVAGLWDWCVLCQESLRRRKGLVALLYGILLCSRALLMDDAQSEDYVFRLLMREQNIPTMILYWFRDVFVAFVSMVHSLVPI